MRKKGSGRSNAQGFAYANVGGGFDPDDVFVENRDMADGHYEREASTVCGCYECQRVFTWGEITEFWDEGETPVCPFCDRDSVVIETADMRVTPARLFAMRRTW